MMLKLFKLRKKFIGERFFVFEDVPAKAPEAHPVEEAQGSVKPAPEVVPQAGPKERRVLSDGVTEPLPGAPSTPEAGVKADVPAKLGEEAKPEKDTGPKPSKLAGLPQDSEWSEKYDVIQQVAEEMGADKDGPFVKMACLFCAWMAKNGDGIFNLMPGRFLASLDKDKLAGEVLDEEQKAKLAEQWKRNLDTEAGKFNLDDIKDLSESETSTVFVSHLLFGSEIPIEKRITDYRVLAARLLHDKTNAKSTFRDTTLRVLNKKDFVIKKGTVIFFTESYKGRPIAAYATGNRKEFIYLKPGMTEPSRFQLDAPDSPVDSEMALKAAFVPAFRTDVNNDEGIDPEIDKELVERPRVDFENKWNELVEYLKRGGGKADAEKILEVTPMSVIHTIDALEEVLEGFSILKGYIDEAKVHGYGKVEELEQKYAADFNAYQLLIEDLEVVYLRFIKEAEEAPSVIEETTKKIEEANKVKPVDTALIKELEAKKVGAVKVQEQYANAQKYSQKPNDIAKRIAVIKVKAKGYSEGKVPLEETPAPEVPAVKSTVEKTVITDNPSVEAPKKASE